MQKWKCLYTRPASTRSNTKNIIISPEVCFTFCFSTRISFLRLTRSCESVRGSTLQEYLDYCVICVAGFVILKRGKVICGIADCKCVIHDNKVRWVWLEVVVHCRTPVGAMSAWMLWLCQRYPQTRRVASFMLSKHRFVHSSCCARNLRALLTWKRMAHCLMFQKHIPAVLKCRLRAVHSRTQPWFSILVTKSAFIGTRHCRSRGNRSVCGTPAIPAFSTLSCSASLSLRLWLITSCSRDTKVSLFVSISISWLLQLTFHLAVL